MGLVNVLFCGVTTYQKRITFGESGHGRNSYLNPFDCPCSRLTCRCVLLLSCAPEFGNVGSRFPVNLSPTGYTFPCFHSLLVCNSHVTQKRERWEESISFLFIFFIFFNSFISLIVHH